MHGEVCARQQIWAGPDLKIHPASWQYFGGLAQSHDLHIVLQLQLHNQLLTHFAVLCIMRLAAVYQQLVVCNTMSMATSVNYR